MASGGQISVAKLGGKTVSLKNGYPDAGSRGIRRALFDIDAFAAMSGEGFITFAQSDAPFAARCSVIYRAAMSAGSAAITHLDTSGC